MTMPYHERMDELSFDGQVAIVTGAGGGIGRAHALELARRGARVVVNDLGGTVEGDGSSATKASAVVAEIREAGGEAVASTDSVATADGGAAIVQTAVDAFGTVDILINNAGILRDASFKNVTPDLLDPVLDVHLKGAFNVTRPAWLIMSEQGRGRIVNTSSGSGLFGNFGQSNYAAAKMGLIGLTRVLAIEGERKGIKTNAIAPIAKTRMTANVMGEAADAYAPEMITPVVVYLAHRSCQVNGHFYSVGAGKVCRVFVGSTPGIEDPGLTPELVAAEIDRIDDTKTFDLR
jgi:NAD(P)-dependent dehydrogenase (short-subunit alcohol dehydrogenase family)